MPKKKKKTKKKDWDRNLLLLLRSLDIYLQWVTVMATACKGASDALVQLKFDIYSEMKADDLGRKIR